MDRETFLHSWYIELERFAPRLVGEQYSPDKFRSSPMVASCLAALDLNEESERLDLVLLEENLKTVLELKSLPQVPRNVISQALIKVQEMKKGTQ